MFIAINVMNMQENFVIAFVRTVWILAFKNVAFFDLLFNLICEAARIVVRYATFPTVMIGASAGIPVFRSLPNFFHSFALFLTERFSVLRNSPIAGTRKVFSALASTAKERKCSSAATSTDANYIITVVTQAVFSASVSHSWIAFLYSLTTRQAGWLSATWRFMSLFVSWSPPSFGYLLANHFASFFSILRHSPPMFLGYILPLFSRALKQGKGLTAAASACASYVIACLAEVIFPRISTRCLWFWLMARATGFRGVCIFPFAHSICILPRIGDSVHG